MRRVTVKQSHLMFSHGLDWTLGPILPPFSTKERIDSEIIHIKVVLFYHFRLIELNLFGIKGIFSVVLRAHEYEQI